MTTILFSAVVEASEASRETPDMTLCRTSPTLFTDFEEKCAIRLGSAEASITCKNLGLKEQEIRIFNHNTAILPAQFLLSLNDDGRTAHGRLMLVGGENVCDVRR